MNRRIRIIMDEKREIKPDWNKNYIVGSWDNSLETAIYHMMELNRTILVIRPEGLELTLHQLWKSKL